MRSSVAVLLLALSLSACGSSQSTSSTETVVPAGMPAVGSPAPAIMLQQVVGHALRGARTDARQRAQRLDEAI